VSNANQRSAHIVLTGFNHVDVKPRPQATSSPEGELSAATSLDDLMKAIVGRESAAPDDRARLVEMVEAQVHGIRQELGIPPPPLPPSFSEFVRSRHPDARGFGASETDGWVSRCGRALSRVLSSSTWRRRPVLLVLVAGGSIVLGFVVGAGPNRSLPAPAGPVLQAAGPAPTMAPVALVEARAATVADSSATVGDSLIPTHAVATSGTAVDRQVTSAPVLLSSVSPVHPGSAPTTAPLGNVEMDVTINKEGRVVNAKVTSGPSALRDPAVAAVLQWRYQPAMTNGAPVASRQRVRLSFE